MPERGILAMFYDGFLFEADIRNMPDIAKNSRELFSELKLENGRNLEMLDVGGGGGFFSKSFENLGYGKSTYVDLDAKACDFARNKLGVSNVINADATQAAFDKKFDFIMCRHIIEHLLNPSEFVLKMTGLLSEKGLLLVMCPNGASIEYLAYPRLGLLNRARIIKGSNPIRSIALLRKFLFGDILHGIDPPRHLWAITGKGMEIFLKRNSLNFKIYTKKLTDKCYSPYYKPRTFFDKKIAPFLVDKFLSRIHGGTHLILEIRK